VRERLADGASRCVGHTRIELTEGKLCRALEEGQHYDKPFRLRSGKDVNVRVCVCLLVCVCEREREREREMEKEGERACEKERERETDSTLICMALV
jgi:hypothetical protein